MKARDVSLSVPNLLFLAHPTNPSVVMWSDWISTPDTAAFT